MLCHWMGHACNNRLGHNVAMDALVHALIHCGASVQLDCCRSGRGKKRKAEGMQTPRDPADGKKDMGHPSPASQEKESPAYQERPSPASQEKSKRKYVKSGKFVGKYGNYQKQRESKLQQQGQADSSKRKRQNAGQLAFSVFCDEHMQRCLCFSSSEAQSGIANLIIMVVSVFQLPPPSCMVSVSFPCLAQHNQKVSKSSLSA